jgi:hypothetical protein
MRRPREVRRDVAAGAELPPWTPLDALERALDACPGAACVVVKRTEDQHVSVALAQLDDFPPKVRLQLTRHSDDPRSRVVVIADAIGTGPTMIFNLSHKEGEGPS